MQRKESKNFATDVFGGATSGGAGPSSTPDSGGIEQAIPGFNQPKTDEIDRLMDSVVTPGMSDKDYWAARDQIQDDLKRTRGNKTDF